MGEEGIIKNTELYLTCEYLNRTDQNRFFTFFLNLLHHIGFVDSITDTWFNLGKRRLFLFSLNIYSYAKIYYEKNGL